MEEKHSIKDGRIEAVMWIVYKDGKVVVEKRPPHPTKETVCIPCGHIDLNQDKDRDAAFLRETQEEFIDGKFIPTKWGFLKSVDFEETNRDGSVGKLRLHYYLVTEWKGKVPKHTIEHKGKHADLVWFSLSKYKELPQSCDREVLAELKEKYD